MCRKTANKQKGTLSDNEERCLRVIDKIPPQTLFGGPADRIWMMTAPLLCVPGLPPVCYYRRAYEAKLFHSNIIMSTEIAPG